MIRFLGRNVLWLRAQQYLARHNPTLIGVTGSYDKTLTRHAIARALSSARHVRTPDESYERPVDIPLSILGVRDAKRRMGWVRLLAGSKLREIMEEEPDMIAFGVGAKRPGDVDSVATSIPCNVGVVTHVGSHNLDLFGSKDMVAHEQMSLIVSLPKDGYAILNADDPLVYDMRTSTQAHVVTYGVGDHVDVQLVRATRNRFRGYIAEVRVGGVSYEAAFPYILKQHQLYAILASLAVANVYDVPIRAALKSVKGIKPEWGRGRLFEGVHGSVVLDDTCDATPESMMGLLDATSQLPARRRFAVLGDMDHLSAESLQWHAWIGRAAVHHADILIAVGDKMREAVKHALKEAGDSGTLFDVHHMHTSRDVGKWLGDHVKKDDLISVSGSSSMKMEEVVKRMIGQ